MSAPAKTAAALKPARDASGRALDLRLMARLYTHVRGYTGGLIVSIVLLPVIAGFELAQPYLLKQAIDQHIAPHRLPGLDRLALLYLAALLGQYAAAFAHNYLV